MAKATKPKKAKPAVHPAASPARTYSAEAQEMRALLRRIPDGLKATLNALANKPQADRERVMVELVRGMSKEVLPLFRAAANSANDELARSAIRTLPVFACRAAADVLAEVHDAAPESPRAALAQQAAIGFRARGIQVPIPEPEDVAEPPRYSLRETWVSAPDGVGSRSVMARLQDQYGVWHAILVLWNDQAGVKDGFMRPLSRQEWDERTRRMEDRGTPQVQCPADFARWQVAEARQLNEVSGLAIGEHLKDWDLLLGPPSAGYAPPDPIAALAQGTAAEREEWLARSAAVMTLPDVTRWFLEAADCAPWARRWSALQNRLGARGAHAPTDAQKERIWEEVTELIYEATDTLMDSRQRELYQGRLLDLSRVLEWRKLETPARQAAAAAAALAEGKPAREIPFVVGLLEWSLRAAEVLMARGEDLERLRYRPLRRRQL
ncbi:MAG: hypothetical protein K0Q72_3709 [Armatimonadetes bacterium]|nr:hypothetical protein [Armatimonadota bacterium]